MRRMHAAPLTTNRRYMRRVFERLVRTHYPRGTRLIGLHIREVGTFQFKHSFRYDLCLRSPNGKKTMILVRGNVPSTDRPFETFVAYRTQHSLARRGFVFGSLRVPASFGVVPKLQINLYEEYPGITLEQLIARHDPRAVTVAAKAGAWLAKLHSAQLTVSPGKTFEQMNRDAGFFRDNIVRSAPTHVEPMIRAVYAAIDAQQQIVARYRRFFCTTHGDLNLGNIVAGRDGSIAFIDFGNSITYDPTSDIGNFLAQLDLLAWRQRCTPQQHAVLARVFIRSYLANVSGVGPRVAQRIAAHHAWWTLQVLAYTLSIMQPLGRRIAPLAIKNAMALLSGAGYAALPSLESSDSAGFKKALLEPGSMHAYFQNHLPTMYPGYQKIEHLIVTHQPALSTTSFLTHFKLDIMRPNGRIDHKNVRGNFVDPATYRLMEVVYRHPHASFMSMRPLLFDVKHRYEFYEEVPGASLRNTPFRSPKFARLIPHIARALAGFHAVPTTGLRSLSWSTERTAIRRNLGRIARALPSYRLAATAAVSLLVRAERRIWLSNRSIVHNDFQASNVIIGGSRIGLIDFTLSAVGNGAIDVGNFLAHLSVMLHGVLPPNRIERIRRSFLTAYLARAPRTRRASLRGAITVFELRSCIDILAITLINLGPRDRNRMKYCALLQQRIKALTNGIEPA